MEETPKEKVNLIIACMDRRMNEPLEERSEREQAATGIRTIALRNAGADVDNLHDSIRGILLKYNVVEARVVVHNDCGAMKDISKRKNGEAWVEPQRDQTAAKYVKTEAVDLCKENMAVQERSLRTLVGALSPSTKVIVSIFDVSHIPSTAEEKKGAIVLDSTERSHTNYSELAGIAKANVSDAYFIQYTGRDNILPDIGLAAKALGIKDMTIFSTDKTDAKATALFEDVNRQEFAAGLHIKLVELKAAHSVEQNRVKLKG